jgi:diguanylate cyclase (GGDEF)-like protein/PAS domain S-box-containing protein
MDVAGIATAIAAALACRAAARRDEPRPRIAWMLLSGAAASWAVAIGLWQLGEGPPGVPHIALVTLALALEAGGLGMLPGTPERASGLARTLVDGLIVAGSALLIVWAVGLSDLYPSADSEGHVALYEALGQLTIAAAAAVVLTRASPRVRPLLAFVAGGMAALALASGALAYIELGGATTAVKALYLGWTAGWLLVGVSTRREADDADRDGPAIPTHASVLIPSVPFAGAVIALAVAAADGDVEAFPIWNAAAVVVLVVARQILALIENISWGRELQARVAERTEELRFSEARFRSLVQHSSDVIVVTDPDGTVRYQSPSMREVFGYEEGELGPELPLDLIHPDDVVRVTAAARDLLQRPGHTASFECRLRNRDGDWRHAEAIATNLLEEPAVGGFVVNVRDITERREREQLAHRAFHDPLTNLANRALFIDRLGHALSRGRRYGGMLAVLFIDLDEFKYVNDRLGHEAGDELLCVIAGRLQESIRAADTVARFGGDEFAILVEQVDGVAEAEQVATRTLQALEAPLELHRERLSIRGSIGLAVTETAGDSAEEMLRSADIAMYAAKARGKGRYALYEPRMYATLADRLELEHDLQDAVEHHELGVFFQPILSLAGGHPVAVEALVRWNHATRGPVGPDRFIPLAERTGLIDSIGQNVLHEACRQAREWGNGDTRKPPMSVAVNISGHELDDPLLGERIGDVLKDSGLDPKRLILEITESAVVDRELGIDRLQELRSVGPRLSIDDFGTGHSSLSHLHRLPVDMLKIDQVFIEGLRRGSHQVSLVQAIVSICRSLGLTPVAEGVEHAEQVRELRRMGCELAQGYYFARPAEPDRIASWLAAGAPWGGQTAVGSARG